MHRVAHHNDADDLIWLYDIHLLAGRLSADGWRELTALARWTQVTAVCAAGLEAAADAFGTMIPVEAAGLRDADARQPTAMTRPATEREDTA